MRKFCITLVGSQMRIGNFISSPVSSLVALSKYSSQNSKISSSGCNLSFVRLNLFIREMFPIVDFKYQFGGFSLNIHSHACSQQIHQFVFISNTMQWLHHLYGLAVVLGQDRDLEEGRDIPVVLECAERPLLADEVVEGDVDALELVAGLDLLARHHEQGCQVHPGVFIRLDFETLPIPVNCLIRTQV